MPFRSAMMNTKQRIFIGVIILDKAEVSKSSKSCFCCVSSQVFSKTRRHRPSANNFS